MKSAADHLAERGRYNSRKEWKAVALTVVASLAFGGLFGCAIYIWGNQ